jgi:hypothetical protein
MGAPTPFTLTVAATSPIEQILACKPVRARYVVADVDTGRDRQKPSCRFGLALIEPEPLAFGFDDASAAIGRRMATTEMLATTTIRPFI